MKFKNFLIVILITLFAQEIAIAKPLPPGTGASAPANILIMLDRTYSMLDPLSGKDNKKTGWLQRAIDVAEGEHSSSSFVLNGRDAGPSYWKHNEDTFHMKGSGVLSNKGVLSKKALDLAFDLPTSMEGYKDGYLYFISTSYDARYGKTGLLKPYLHLISYDTKGELSNNTKDFAFFFTQSYAQSASGTENCSQAKKKKSKNGPVSSNYYTDKGECFTYPGDPTPDKDFYHGALAVNGDILIFTSEHTHLSFNLNSYKDGKTKNHHLNNKNYVNCSTSDTNYKKYFSNSEGIEVVREGSGIFVYIKKYKSNEIAKFRTASNGCITGAPIQIIQDTHCGWGRGDSITIHNNHIYTTGFTKGKVCKYRLDGTFVTSTGQLGSDTVNTVAAHPVVYFANPMGINYVNGNIHVANTERLEVTILDPNNLKFIGDYGNDGVTRIQGAQDAIASVVTDGTLVQEASFGLALWAREEQASFKSFIGDDRTKPFPCKRDGCLEIGIHRQGAQAIYNKMLEGFPLRLKTRALSFARLAHDYYNSTYSPKDDDLPCQVNAIIIIGDGEWDDKANNLNDAMNKIATLKNRGIKTYAVPYGDGIKKYDNYQLLAEKGGTDTYYKALTAAELKTLLKSIVQSIVSQTVSYSAPSISAELKESGELYQAKFQYRSDKEWWGTIIKTELTENGDATTANQKWDAAKIMKAPSARKIWTVLPDVSYQTNYNNFNKSNYNSIRNNLFSLRGNAVLDYHRKTGSGTRCKSNTLVKDGANEDDTKGLIGFVRGEDWFDYNGNCNLTEHRTRKDKNGNVFKAYLGDIYNSQLLVVGRPKASFTSQSTNEESYWRGINGYEAWANTPNNYNRQRTIYVGANNGILHAFNADTGEEMWGFVPPLIAARLPEVINPTAANSAEGGTNPLFLVDGSPTVHDTYFKHPITNKEGWYTLLMVNYGRGGAGFTTLDVTDPNKPLHLYSILNDPVSQKVFHVDHKDDFKSYPYKTARYNIFDFTETTTVVDNFNLGGFSKTCDASLNTYCYEGRTWTLTGVALDPADGEIKVSLNGNLLGSGDYTLNNSSGETKITFNSAVPFYSAKRDDNDKSNSTINISQVGNIDPRGVNYDYRFLGDTWGSARVFRMPNDGAGDKSINDDLYVAAMPGGYGVGSPGIGSNLYVINWENGSVVKRVDIEDLPYSASFNDITNSIPATPVVITSDDSLGPYRGAMVYLNDLEGKVTKINLTNLEYEHAFDPDDNSLSQKTEKIDLYEQTTLLNLQSSTKLNNRLMFHPMDAGIGIKTKKLHLWAGTGDFMNLNDVLVDKTKVKNVMFGIKDSHFPFFGHVNTPQTADTLEKCKDVPTDGTENCPDISDAGWYVQLDDRKKITAEPTMRGNAVYFPIYKPTTGSKSCGAGNAYICALNADCGTNLSSQLGDNTGAEAGEECYYVGVGVLSKIIAFGTKLYANISGTSEVYDPKDDLVIIEALAEDIDQFRSSWRENF